MSAQRFRRDRWTRPHRRQKSVRSALWNRKVFHWKMCPSDWIALSPPVTRERQRFQYWQQKIRVTIDWRVQTANVSVLFISLHVQPTSHNWITILRCLWPPKLNLRPFCICRITPVSFFDENRFSRQTFEAIYSLTWTAIINTGTREWKFPSQLSSARQHCSRFLFHTENRWNWISKWLQTRSPLEVAATRTLNALSILLTRSQTKIPISKPERPQVERNDLISWKSAAMLCLV